MPDIIRYPFKLEAAFFTNVSCKRAAEIPNEIQTVFKAHVKVVPTDQLHFQVFIKLETETEQPITFNMELVALYAYIGEQSIPDRAIIEEFINEQALHALWPYTVQLLAQLTCQMGTNPIRLPTPYRYEVHHES